MTAEMKPPLPELIAERYGDDTGSIPQGAGAKGLAPMLARGSCRAFDGRPVPLEILNLLSAAALASPTKSDLQQRDIVLVRSTAKRAALADLVSGQSWVADAPMIAVFCGNNRRQRLLHEWHAVPFANDHLDAFFNATVDAAVALSAFVTAAEILGLGCCPISAVRNRAAEVSALIELPKHVFPVAGLALGYPKAPPVIAKRLPLGVTCHLDRYQEPDLEQAVRTYDEARSHKQPYAQQRFEDRFGKQDPYGWSDDKVRQYSEVERGDFGAFVRANGFNLD